MQTKPNDITELVSGYLHDNGYEYRRLLASEYEQEIGIRPRVRIFDPTNREQLGCVLEWDVMIWGNGTIEHPDHASPSLYHGFDSREEEKAYFDKYNWGSIPIGDVDSRFINAATDNIEGFVHDRLSRLEDERDNLFRDNAERWSDFLYSKGGNIEFAHQGADTLTKDRFKDPTNWLQKPAGGLWFCEYNAGEMTSWQAWSSTEARGARGTPPLSANDIKETAFTLKENARVYLIDSVQNAKDLVSCYGKENKNREDVESIDFTEVKDDYDVVYMTEKGEHECHRSWYITSWDMESGVVLNWDAIAGQRTVTDAEKREIYEKIDEIYNHDMYNDIKEMIDEAFREDDAGELIASAHDAENGISDWTSEEKTAAKEDETGRMTKDVLREEGTAVVDEGGNDSADAAVSMAEGDGDSVEAAPDDVDDNDPWDSVD